VPVYEYDCAACGPFAALRPMSEYLDPGRCPGCDADTPRAMLTAPALAGMDSGRRRAFETNERSASAPRLSSASHGASCACCRPTASDKSRAVKGFVNKRPWMISH